MLNPGGMQMAAANIGIPTYDAPCTANRENVGNLLSSLIDQIRANRNVIESTIETVCSPAPAQNLAQNLAQNDENSKPLMPPTLDMILSEFVKAIAENNAILAGLNERLSGRLGGTRIL